QNIQMLLGLQQISVEFKSAEIDAAQAQAKQALAALDRALNIAQSIRTQRNDALQNTTNICYESWSPRLPEANGRKFLNEVDDVKDHLPVRTSDMTYLIYRELLYPLGDWAKQTTAVRNEYAETHHLPLRNFSLDWQSTTAGSN